MSQKTIVLDIPDELYERLQEAAEASGRSVEHVLLESIEVIFQAETELPRVETFADCTNELLWSVVQRRLSWSQSLRLRELSGKNKVQPLTEIEQTELVHLLDLVDNYMLMRSEALLLLKQRGQNIDAYLKLGA